MRSSTLPMMTFALMMSLALPGESHAAQGDSVNVDAAKNFGNAVPDFGSAVPDDKLGTLRGGQDQTVNDMKLYAQLYDNKVISSVTGNNTVTQDAFAGAQGFATVIQNSGNNVIIQNATILNLRMQ
jgi:hypothetical protein